MRQTGGDRAPEPGWYVLTGRPCSGITTTVNALAARGYRTVPEAARSIIDERVAAGWTIERIRGDEARFQREILARKFAAESRTPTGAVVFFDRAMPDNIVYHAIAGLDPAEARRLCRGNAYRKIFFMEPLPYAGDYARTESAAVLKRLERELPAAYRNLGYEVVSVPAAPVERRVERILREL